MAISTMALSAILCARSTRQLTGCHQTRLKSAFHPLVCTFSTHMDSFYTSSSIRSQRRKRRLTLWQKRQERGNSPDSSSADREDNRTIRDILFPSPDYGEETIQTQKRYPRTLSGWRDGVRQGWLTYRATWDGFFTSKGFIVEHKEPIEAQSPDLKETLNSKADQVKENVRQNAQFLHQESDALRAKVTETTGISTKEDLRRVAAEMMRLAADCVNQFMQGYRKGRDDEVEKMLTQYFQEMETAANKPRRRKIKRRVVKHAR